MGWFTRKVDNWASGKQEEELKDFIKRLQGMDGEEIGLIVAVANNHRVLFEAAGHLVSDPINLVASDPMFTAKLSTTVVGLQKEGALTAAAGGMVWVHTLRAATRLELRSLGRDMWAQLERGFPHVVASALGYEALTGIQINLTGYREFPKGLTPMPT